MSRLAQHRKAAGLTQVQLADRAGVSRQLIGAVEAGRNIPRVDAAVAIAATLGVSVESLFGSDGAPSDVLTGAAPREGDLLRAGRVGARLVTAPLHRGTEGWGPADGRLVGGDFESLSDLRDGLIVVGCEPGLEVLERSLRQAGAAAVAVLASSAAAIAALQAGRAHAAVVHGPALGRADEVTGIARIRLASWEVGLAGAPDAGTGWVEAALGGRAPVAQREQGAGVQQTFLSVAETSEIPGPTVAGHLDAASYAVLGGMAAVTIEPAAAAVGAVFHSFEVHHSELWIGSDWVDDRAIIEALDVLAGRAFQLRLAAVGGYDLTDFGSRVA